MTGTPGDLQHRPWCANSTNTYRYDDGRLLLVRCRSCRAELQRITRKEKR